MSKPALLFDLDGTLLDSKPGIVNSFQLACEELDLRVPSSDELHEFIGPPLPVMLAELCGEDDQHIVKRFIDCYRESYIAKGMYESKVYPGIEKLLSAKREHNDLFVATSKPHKHALTMLRHFGLDEYFCHVHGSELNGDRFDKTSLIAYVLETEGLASQGTWMVGDRRYDIAGARANSVRGIGITWGYGSREELDEAGATAVFDVVDDLSHFLDERETLN